MTYEIQCEHCDQTVHFEIYEIPALDRYIEDEIEGAKDDVRDVYSGLVEPCDLVNNRLLLDLSAAIRAGDRNEAEYLLDRLASDFGDDATEHVQRGRYSVKAMA